MKLDKDKILGIAGTVLLHGIILALFFVLFLRTEKPLPGEEGVLVNIGYMEEGTGEVQEEQPMEEEQPTPPARQQQEPSEPESEKELMTQEAQEAPALEDEEEVKEEEKEKPEEEKEEVKEEPEEIQEEPEEEIEEEPEEKEPEVNQRALYKGKSEEEGKDQGDTGEAGDQGSPFGSEDSDNQEGEGGLGNGISFSLSGRSAKHLPKPEYKSQDEGKVVVTIYVDKFGNVKRAEAGAKGTTVTDLRLRKLAQKAALRAKFSQNPEAPEIQKGTITYNFIRMEN